MKSVVWKSSLMPGVCCLMLLGAPTRPFAADQNPAGSDERLQRIEQRINELAERQEQLMRRFGGPQERQGPMAQPGPMPQPGPIPQPGMMPQPGPMAKPGPMPQPGMMPQPGHEKALHDIGGMLRLVILAGTVCNILMAIWIFTDIRKRGEGSGIFIALALVAGIPAAIIYALVRIGDKASVGGKQAG